jgi:PAS domain S-box-containing protein
MLNITGWAEEELKHTLKELADLKFALDASSIVAITDRRGIIKFVNEKFCEISQYTTEELLGQDHRIINSGYHPPDFFKMMWKTISKGEIWRGEIRNQAKDGTFYWVDTTIVPFLDDEGKPYQYVSIRSDITKRKQAEEDLKMTMKQLADLKYAIEESSIVAITDRQGTIQYVNDRFCMISKYSREELIGQDHRIINSGQHSKEFFRDLWKTIGQGKVWKGEIQNRAKDGAYYWVDTIIVPFLNEQGKPYQYVSIRSDITERKMSEELLRNSERLTIVSQLAAGVAHEIRNPLTALKRIVRMLGGKNNLYDATEYFPLILSELDRIEFIMNEYLMLAKPQVVKFAEKRVSYMLESIVKLLTVHASMNSIRVVTELDPDLTIINCDENQLKQVFINLIKNAFEAMPNGGKLLIQAQQPDPDHILVRFVDEGVGIPEEVLAKLGEPFFTTKEKGTGLGLMVSFRIVESHHGTLTFKSQSGQGTTAEILLPVANR